MLVPSLEDAWIGGDVAEGFGGVADAFRSNFRTRGEVGAAVAVYRDGREGCRSLGRLARPTTRSSMGSRHVGARVLDDEGNVCRGSRCCSLARHVPARRASRLVLAGVRTTRQGARDGQATPGPRSRPCGDRPASRSGHDRRSRVTRCCPRRPSAEVAARSGARVPRTDARVVREPTTPTSRSSPQIHRSVLRRRSCRSPRCPVLHRHHR